MVFAIAYPFLLHTRLEVPSPSGVGFHTLSLTGDLLLSFLRTLEDIGLVPATASREERLEGSLVPPAVRGA